ncbi:hypothetical protein ACS0TY_006945 [Phlomoides rotata]
MAAYAALVSLTNNMQQIQNHPRLSTSFDKKQMESLLQRLNFLLDFIQSHNSYGGSKDEVEELERQIASAAHSAEDLIESHIVDQILAGSTEEVSNFSDLLKIIQEIDSVKEKVVKVKEERGKTVELPESPIAAAAAAASRPGKSNMVGFGDYLIRLLEELTGEQSDRQIIPVVGMGGIGKTTLARNAYGNLLVVQHFDVRAWTVVSQSCHVREILFEILCCLGQSKGMDEESDHELGEKVYKTLSGRRYLIILDDLWGIDVWDKIKFYFPNNCNRSRIIVTTRISDVANQLGSMGLTLSFLDDDQSWKLFCDKVFPQQVCPPELEESGRKIVKRCQGLPLAIVVIGGLLGNSSRTQREWENVEKDVRSILNTVEDSLCSKLLSLSYSHLPACLKPCFLYLGIYPEDQVIRVSILVKLWVAEGFIKPNKDQSLEEIAECYIKDLVDRNLISVHSLRWSGKFKTCYIHDLLRDLCIRIAEKEKFLCAMNVCDTPQEIDTQRRIIIHGSTTVKECYPGVLDTLNSKSLARSLISKCNLVHAKPRLLRVLVEIYSERIDKTFDEVNMRFLAHESATGPSGWLRTYHLPSSISLLWNVQTLIMTGRVEEVVAPSQIWEMLQLRHLKFKKITLPDPPPSGGSVLHNLQTLGTVQNFRCSEDAFKRMPNVKKLRVSYDDFSRGGETWSYYCLCNFVFFDKIESLHYNFKLPNRVDLLQSLMLPSSLKKLTINFCELEWNDLTIFGSLPHLEALKLWNAVIGPNWDPVEGEFLRLKYLEISWSIELICWNADNFHFPVLENLVLEQMFNLDEIPLGIGETLQRISMVNCSVSSALSAVKILEEQESLGNQGLQVNVKFMYPSDVEEFMEQVDAESLKGLNFHFKCM